MVVVVVMKSNIVMLNFRLMVILKIAETIQKSSFQVDLVYSELYLGKFLKIFMQNGIIFNDQFYFADFIY